MCPHPFQTYWIRSSAWCKSASLVLVESIGLSQLAPLQDQAHFSEQYSTAVAQSIWCFSYPLSSCAYLVSLLFRSTTPPHWWLCTSQMWRRMILSPFSADWMGKELWMMWLTIVSWAESPLHSASECSPRKHSPGTSFNSFYGNQALFPLLLLNITSEYSTSSVRETQIVSDVTETFLYWIFLYI